MKPALLESPGVAATRVGYRFLDMLIGRNLWTNTAFNPSSIQVITTELTRIIKPEAASKVNLAKKLSIVKMVFRR